MKEDGSRLRILKANHGDAFIIEVKRGDDLFTMVIDGGPRVANRVVIPQLVQLTDKGKIDIMALTHFDNDHIHGLLEFLKTHKDRVGKIGKFWINLPERVKVADDSPELTYEEARDLRDEMEKLEKETVNKIDWRERLIADEKSDQPLYQNDLVKIWVLAPSEEDIERNERCFRKKIGEELVNINLSGNNEKQPLRPLEEIWEEEWKDTSPLNAASSAFLIKCYDGRTFLMCGDANPDTIEKSLRKMDYSEEHPLKVDVFKLPHHGSRKNIRNSLLDIVVADAYLISTNGGWASTRHPDRETIAKLLLHPKRNRDKVCRICLNYDLPTIRHHSGDIITGEEIRENKYNFVIDESVEIL